MSEKKLEPKLITVLREGYTFSHFSKDLTAGVIVGIVALPLAIAFAIASGVKPEQGLYTAIIAGFLISALSGSRVQIGGPTGAFIVIVYGIVQQYGYDGLATATLISGILLIAMGFARLGAVIKFIPYPVTVGFTTGIALIIFAGQIRDFLGLDIATVPSEFIEKWVAYAHHFDSFNPAALGLGVLTIVTVQLFPRVTRLVPGSLVAILVTTALVSLFNLPVETIGSRFGEVPTSLPKPQLPNISFELIGQMFSPALSIALLAGIESLLSAVVADGMTGRRHRSDMELIAQGVANIFSPIFGGIPATGAIARTATNIKNGGITPISGIIHAITLLLIMLFFGKWAALIPMPTLAGILIVVSYNMSEWHLFVKLFRSPRSDVLVLLATFLLTVLLDLTVAIQVGVVLAALLFMRRMSEVTKVGYVTRQMNDEDAAEEPMEDQAGIPDGVEIFEVNGPFFFGAAERFKSALGVVHQKPQVLILRMRHVLSIDATGIKALDEVIAKTQREGTHLILSGVHTQPLFALEKIGLVDQIGRENLCENLDNSIKRAKKIISTAAQH
ncbi:MAG: sulfate permease [Calditrichaeota bacterium]|nr:sulfate permease [Calditrichota bacterium]MCB0269879.1 sulfate permease [Calditrichota bacterium]